MEPDARFHSVHIQAFINRVMQRGKKSTAASLVYDALDLIEERTKKNPVDTFELALKNVSPVMEVKPRRVGGATYQVPVEVESKRGQALAMRWLISAARTRAGKTMAEKLAAELTDAAQNQGATIKKREDTHKMAEANRAFAHYRW